MDKKERVTIEMSRELRQSLEWMTNPSTSQKVPKYVQKGMDDLKEQIRKQGLN